MARYICVDDFLEKMKQTPRYFDVKFDIEKFPTADVVEVPCRCSECKHLEIINKEPVYAECKKQKLTFLLWQADTREHFCSYGERKEGEQDG